MPETVQFSISFTLQVIYLTLALLAKWLTELPVHPGDLREILFGLMEFFFLSVSLVWSMLNIMHVPESGAHWPSFLIAPGFCT